jgi:hypothetical protein
MLAEQFDALIHIDETAGVEPPKRPSVCGVGELPETYPHGV